MFARDCRTPSGHLPLGASELHAYPWDGVATVNPLPRQCLKHINAHHVPKGGLIAQCAIGLNDRGSEDLGVKFGGRLAVRFPAPLWPSEECIFMLMGKVIEHADTADMFVTPAKKETANYIEGRYG